MFASHCIGLRLNEGPKDIPSTIICRDKELANLSYVNLIKFVLVDVADAHTVQTTLTHGGAEPCFKPS